jgi:protein tyrosine phosphatase (PTP) superfamily phosphohydrolase (DUF442 family)
MTMATDVQHTAEKPPEAPVPRKRGGGARALVIGLLIAAGAAFYLFKIDTYHYIEVADGVLYRDGNQDMRRFTTALGRANPKTVIPLIDDGELADPDKKQFVEEMTVAPEHGATIERIPVKLGGWPTTEDVRKFLEIAENKDKQPVLIHCAQGVRRTGMMVAAYQMSVLGWSKERANQEIETFGHSERTVGDIRRFIAIYDPATRTVTETLQQSKE